MTTTAESAPHGDFFRIAVERDLLSEKAAKKLANHVAMRGLPPGPMALELGLLEPVQVDIIDTLLKPTESVPGYEILDILGCGGMGVVYRARQKTLDRVVALKTVLISQLAQPGALARFEQEAITVARLTHPNIVAAYDFGKHGGRFFLAMELLDGEDSEALINQRGRLDEATAWCLARQAAAGLAHAAKAGVVHRDVKPANLFLVPPPVGFPLPPGMPQVKITDFGLALVTKTNAADVRLTISGTTLGSPHYMSPEQFSGSDVDFRADIYALGASVFQMLSGSVPYRGSLADVITQKMNGQVPDLRNFAPDVTQASARLVAEMMARNLKDRIGDYDTLLRRIDALPKFPPPAIAQGLSLRSSVVRRATAAPAADVPTRTMDASPTVGVPHVGRWGLRWVALGAVLVVALAAAGGWWLWLRELSLPERPTMVRAGWDDLLYDGKTLQDWQALPGGGWSYDKNAEGGIVLAGHGHIRRKLAAQDGQPLASYRLAVNVDLHEATAVELHFGLRSGVAREPPRNVLRVTRDATTLGNRIGDSGPLEATAQAAGLGPAADLEKGPQYHELRVERQDNVWWAFVDGRTLGALPATPSSELPEFHLIAEGGTAHFDAPHLAELARPD